MNEVRAMFSAYAAWPGVELSFQHYDRELSFLPGRCAPPSGRFLLARADVRPPAAPVCAGFPEHGANRNGSMCARRSETRLLPAREHSGKRKRAVFPGAFPSLAQSVLRLNISAGQILCSGLQVSRFHRSSRKWTAATPEKGSCATPLAVSAKRVTDRESGEESRPARPRGALHERNAPKLRYRASANI